MPSQNGIGLVRLPLLKVGHIRHHMSWKMLIHCTECLEDGVFLELTHGISTAVQALVHLASIVSRPGCANEFYRHHPDEDTTRLELAVRT